MIEKCICFKCQNEIKDRKGISFGIADLKETTIENFTVDDWEGISSNSRCSIVLHGNREHIFNICLCYDCADKFLKTTFSENVAKIIRDDFGIKEKGEPE